MALNLNAHEDFVIFIQIHNVFVGLGDVFVSLGTATIFGAMLGLNRQMHRKPAGLRTHALASLGAALAILTIIRFSAGLGTNEASRVMQGIITGIGFIGAGVIIHHGKRDRVEGLTTAASIWLSAMIGLACGAGEWKIAGISMLFAFAILIFGGRFERGFVRLFRGKLPNDINLNFKQKNNVGTNNICSPTNEDNTNQPLVKDSSKYD